MKKLGKYSIGIGDRFGRQGVAQLQAMMKAKEDGITIFPVWNKSFREHNHVKTQPSDTRIEADSAVKTCGWTDDYFVDADHVSKKTIEIFIESSDFFTVDVADFIGKLAEENAIKNFVNQHQKYIGTMNIPNIQQPFDVTEKRIEEIAYKYLFAIQEAGRIYRYLVGKKRGEEFVIEVSMDETSEPQSPLEIFFILAALAMEKIPAQTIAPKFSGRFNKGVDYVGKVNQFAKEFEHDLAVIQFAVQEFALPANLKLSVHSGSDKFIIYEPIKNALKKFDAGLHLKTAGTTWLEELIGLAEAGSDGLAMAKKIYRKAYFEAEALCKPYATVIDIDFRKLPKPGQVETWQGFEYASVLRHDSSNTLYNPHFRQLLHVGYKVAAEIGERYLNLLEKHKKIIAKNVTENLYDRHIKKVFIQ